MSSSGGQNAKVLADIYAEHRNRPQLYPNVKRVPNEFQLLRVSTGIESRIHGFSRRRSKKWGSKRMK
jgi:hypothetical protein